MRVGPRRRPAAVLLALALLATAVGLLAPAAPAEAAGTIDVVAAQTKRTTMPFEVYDVTLTVTEGGVPVPTFSYVVYGSTTGYTRDKGDWLGTGTAGTASYRAFGTDVGPRYLTVVVQGTASDGTPFEAIAVYQHDIELGEQTITFNPPGSARVGDYLGITATGGASLAPVVFSINPQTTPGACRLDGARHVRFEKRGECYVDASQAAQGYYAAAETVTQRIVVQRGIQNFAFGSRRDQIVGTTYAISVDGGDSGNPVEISLLSPAVCTFVDGTSEALDAGTISFLAPGRCEWRLFQDGNDDWQPAQLVPPAFEVTRKLQTIDFELPTEATYGDVLPLSAAGGATGNPVTFSSRTPTTCRVEGAAVRMTSSGSCQVMASQDGNDEYEAARPVIRAVSVAAAPLRITTPAGSQRYGDGPVAFPLQVTGLVAGDTIAGLFTTAPTCRTASSLGNPTPGSYPGGISSCGGGVPAAGTTGRYAIEFLDADLTVGKALLQVIAEDKQRRFTEANPALTVRYEGFVAGDGPAVLQGTPSVSTSAGSDASAGTYLIVPSVTGVTAANYELVPVLGRLVVAKAPLAIDAPKVRVGTLAANGGVVFTAGLRTDLGGRPPAVGVPVTFIAKNSLNYTLSCTAVTDAFGVATCRHHNGTAMLFASSYTVSVAESQNHLAGSATGKVGA